MSGYELLDSGLGRKLERIGRFRCVRQAPQAHWRPRLGEEAWQAIDGVHHRHSSGGGRWEFTGKAPDPFDVDYGGLTLKIQPTDFGHVGLFPEQIDNWTFLRNRISAAGRPIRLLNLFAYTGGSTLAAASAGAEAVHVDGSRGVVGWARENARRSGLDDRPIRWLAEDVMKFVRRELRRGSRYEAVVLDPPSFGRGPKGEIWKIETHLPELLDAVRTLLAPRPLLVVASCHSPGYSPMVLESIVRDHLAEILPISEAGEMRIPQSSWDRPLPAGVRCRLWNREENE